MQDTRGVNYFFYAGRPIIPSHPPHLIVIAKIQNPLNNIGGMALGVNVFWINVPEESLTEFNGIGFFHSIEH